MSITVHERPGVYSSYAASSAVSGSAGKKNVGLAVRMEQPAKTVWTINTYQDAVAAFGPAAGNSAAQLSKLLLQNGAAQVMVFPVTGAALSDYQAVFTHMESVQDLAVVMCDSTQLDVQQALRDSVHAASQAQCERIAVVAGTANNTVTELVERAENLNSERVVLTAPGCISSDGTAMDGVQVAAAVAGAIAGETDPAVPLGGAQLTGLNGLNQQLREEELDVLIQGGITAVESAGGIVSVVRGVTTRTSTNGAADRTWRDLCAILVVDDVIPAIRNALKSRFRRAKNTAQSRGAIRSQVVLELENKLAREIITGYEQVRVRADEEDPTRCLVDFSFTVTHGINQIWLSAHITV